MASSSQTTTDHTTIRRWAEARGGDEWFEQFENNGLALLYQDTTDGGGRSNFNKLVSRNG